jgi:hypothetical protein
MRAVRVACRNDFNIDRDFIRKAKADGVPFGVEELLQNESASEGSSSSSLKYWKSKPAT